MPQAVPTQHPAVVLRSHYRQLRALLAVATIAVVGLSAAVVILADDEATSTRTATPVSAPTEPADGPRYIHAPGQRYDPGPAAPSRPSRAGSAPSPQDGATDAPLRSQPRGPHPEPARRAAEPARAPLGARTNGPGMRR